MASDGALVRRLLEGKRLAKALQETAAPSHLASNSRFRAIAARPSAARGGGDELDALSGPTRHLLLYGNTGGNEEIRGGGGDRMLRVFRGANATAYAKEERRLLSLQRQHQAAARRLEAGAVRALLSAHRPALALEDAQRIRVRRYGDPARDVAAMRAQEKEQRAREKLERAAAREDDDDEGDPAAM
jgi:hypothetical protein